MTTYQMASGASAYSQPFHAANSTRDSSSRIQSDGQQPYQAAWTAVIDELLRFRTLDNDWDGMGSDSPHPSLVDRAILLAMEYQTKGSPAPDIVHVSVNSTIFFEWYTSFGYCEIEILSPMDIERRFVRTGSTVAEIVRLAR